MSDPAPEPLPFATLGIPSWRGLCRPVLRQATRSRLDGGAFGQPTVVSVTHAYHLHEEQYARAVIGQAPAYPGRDLPAAAHSSALSYLTRPRTGRTRVNAPVATEETVIAVEGTPVTALRVNWGEPRIAHICFDWGGYRRIEIAAWEYPLDTDFFASLATMP